MTRSALCPLLSALSLIASGSAQAPTGTSGAASKRNGAPAQIERRPNVNDLGMHAAHHAQDLRRSVVYLESAPSLAFPESEPQRATMDQRNETFVPHVLAITVGTTVDFPNSDNIYHNVFSLRGPAVRSRPLCRRPLEVGPLRSTRHRPVFCEIHSHMNAFILVFNHRYFAVTRLTAGIKSIASLQAGTPSSPGTRASIRESPIHRHPRGWRPC